MFNHQDPQVSGKWLRDSLLLTASILAFYLCWLGSYPFFTPDEGRYGEIAREMLASGDYITPRINGVAFLDKPILYYWLQAAMMAVFGVKEWVLRLMPVLLGTLCCILTYICGRQLYDRRTGIVAAIILASTPLYFAGAHYANLDLEVAVWISCCLLSFITGVQNSNPKLRRLFLLAAYSFSALAILTKGLIGIVFPVMIIGAWIVVQNRWRLLTQIHLFKGLLLIAAITLPWYYLAQQANADFLHYFFVTQHFSRFLAKGSFNNPNPWWFYLPVLFVGFLPWCSFLFQSLYAAIRRHQSTDIFLLLWLTLIFVFFSIPHSKIITYILPIFPAMALLVARYLTQATAAQWIRGTRIFILANLIFASFLYANAYHHWLSLPADFTQSLYILAGISALGAILATMSKQPKKHLISIAVACNIFFLLTLTANAKYLNKNTVKPLITQLQPMLQAQDEVYTYLDFFQDVPLYLGRTVGVVAYWDMPDIVTHDNWMRELSYNMTNNPSSNLVNVAQFWKNWEGNNRVYVFLDKKFIEHFKMQTQHCHVINIDHDICLVTNKK